MDVKTRRVRQALTFVALLSCGGCAALTTMTSHEPESRQAPVMTASPAVTTVEEPRKFECSDGTITNSQYDCLVAMARARLPPSDPAK
jgi:uncharacterized protein YcfJ